MELEQFEPSATAADIVARVRAFVEQELMPLEDTFLQEGFAAVLPVLAEKRALVKRLGLWAPAHPRAFGGMGLTLVDFAYVSEALGRSPLGHYAFNSQAPDIGNFELIHQFGTQAQQQRWLPPLVAGEIRSCFAMTEPHNSGANPLFLTARAVRDGEDFVINGRKWFTTGADGAALCVAMVNTAPDAPEHERTSMLLVPTDTPGFACLRNSPVMGHAGSGWASHAEVQFDDCRVPAANLLGAEGEGFRLAQARLGPGRIHHCMRWLGICARALELMVERARTRVIGRGDRRLADSDIVRVWIGECAAEIQAARLLTLYTAWRIQTAGAKAARNDISMIKFYVARVLQQTVDRALQVHGALGVTDYTVLAWYYREERAARIYDGPDEVHKLAVARRLLRD
jgi:alkylation response protein AidB-like acyl-CoA dehydrogenase